MALISRLGVVLGLDTSEFVKGLGIADTKLKDFGSKVKTGLATAVALAGAEMIAATKQAADYADEMFKASQKVGVTTEQLSALRYAADLADVEFGQLQGGLIKLSKAMNEAYTGSDNMKQAFKDAGIAITDNNGKLRDTNTVFIELADRFQKANDGATKTAMAMKFFGKSGAEMIPMLNGGAKAIKDATVEAEKFGKVVSTEQGKASEAFNDNMRRMAEATKGLQIQFGNKLIPAFASAAEWMVETAKKGEYLKAVLLGIGLAFAKLIKGADFGTEMGNLDKQIKTYEITLGNLHARLRQLQGMDSWMDKVFPKGKKTEIAGIENEIGKVNARLIELQHKRDQLKKQQDADKASNADPAKDDFAVTNDEATKLSEKIDKQILAYQKQKEALKGVVTEVKELQLQFGKGGDFEEASKAQKDKLLSAAEELDLAKHRLVVQNHINQSENEYAKAKFAELEADKQLAASETIRLQQHQDNVRFRLEDLQVAQQREQLEMSMAGQADIVVERALRLFDIQQKINQEKRANGLLTESEVNQLRDAEQALARAEEANKRAQNTFQAGWNKAYANFQERANDSAALGAQAFQSMTSSMENALSNFVRTGKTSFKEFATSIIQDMLMIQMKAQMTSIFGGGGGIGGFFSDIFGGGGVSATAGAYGIDSNPFLNWTGPAAANGGNINGPTLVGEKGMELFVPRNSGTIIPNNQLSNMMGSQPQVVYNAPVIQNMNAIDTQSGVQFIAKNKDAIWAANQSANRSLPMSR